MREDGQQDVMRREIASQAGLPSLHRALGLPVGRAKGLVQPAMEGAESSDLCPAPWTPPGFGRSKISTASSTVKLAQPAQLSSPSSHSCSAVKAFTHCLPRAGECRGPMQPGQ